MACGFRGFEFTIGETMTAGSWQGSHLKEEHKAERGERERKRDEGGPRETETGTGTRLLKL